METKLYEIKVTLSRQQKEEIFCAFIKRKKILLFLENDSLTGEDTLLVPERSFKWDINHSIGDKETFSEFNKRQETLCALPEKTFFELENHGFYLVPSINDEGVKNFRLYTPPTVVERLEKARKKDEFILIDLNYSLLSTETEYSVLENLRKLM